MTQFIRLGLIDSDIIYGAQFIDDTLNTQSDMSLILHDQFYLTLFDIQSLAG